MKVVITIPAYNEDDTIGRVVESIKKVMDTLHYRYDVLVVDDGSSDSTSIKAQEAGAVVFKHPKNYGLATAFNTELEQCLILGADIIVHTDADGQYRADEIPKLVSEVEKGCDLVLGSRFMGRIDYMPWLKRAGNKAFSKIISHISGMRISDGQTGFRAFTKEVAQAISITSTFTYTQEQIIKAVRKKFMVREIPVHFMRRAAGESRLMKNPVDFAVKAGVNIMRIYRDYEPLKFFGISGGFFIFLGFALGLFIVYNIIMTGRAGGVPRVILSALLIMTGLQIVFFGFLADMNRGDKQ